MSQNWLTRHRVWPTCWATGWGLHSPQSSGIQWQWFIFWRSSSSWAESVSNRMTISQHLRVPTIPARLCDQILSSPPKMYSILPNLEIQSRPPHIGMRVKHGWKVKFWDIVNWLKGQTSLRWFLSISYYLRWRMKRIRWQKFLKNPNIQMAVKLRSKHIFKKKLNFHMSP